MSDDNQAEMLRVLFLCLAEELQKGLPSDGPARNADVFPENSAVRTAGAFEEVPQQHQRKHVFEIAPSDTGEPLPQCDARGDVVIPEFGMADDVVAFFAEVRETSD